jgi:hypothetical protein
MKNILKKQRRWKEYEAEVGEQKIKVRMNKQRKIKTKCKENRKQQQKTENKN